MHEYEYIGPRLIPEGDLAELARSKMLAFDIESTGLSPVLDEPLGFSITDNPAYAFYASMDNKRFVDLLADESVLKVAHNAKFDRSMLKRAGTTINNLCDPMIAAHLLEWDNLSLKDLAYLFLDWRITSFEELDKGISDMSPAELATYSCPHSQSTLALWGYLEPRLKRLGLDKPFWNIEMPLVPVLSDIELNGVAIDRAHLSTLGKKFSDTIALLQQDLDAIAGKRGMNHNSPDQVRAFIFDDLGFEPKRWTNGKERKPSVDKRFLETIQNKHPYIGLYLAFKELMTLKNSYTVSLGKKIHDDGRIYGTFNQTRTRTGRLSSSDPNLQKIPKRTELGKSIRSAFVAPPGKKLIKPDYDLLELKEMAHQSQDPDLLAAFIAGRDIHTETAIKLYGSVDDRFRGKTANFQIINQGGDRKTRKALEEAYPQVFKWSREMNLQARMNMYATTRGGRIRTIDDLDPDNPAWVIAHGEREAMSTRIQGSAAEEVKKGMVRAWKALQGSSAKMLMQVHDEVVLEADLNDVNDVINILYSEMETDELSIPLTVTVEVGDDWGHMQEVKKGDKYVR